MKQVEIFKDDKLYKSFISIKKASDYMNKNITMCRKYLEGKEDKDGYVWKFKTQIFKQYVRLKIRLYF